MNAVAALPVESIHLANGFQILYQRDSRLPLVAVKLCFLAGSRCDPAQLSGLAHMCEHLACLGNARAQQLAFTLGGVPNGWTFHDRTCFGEVLPSHLLRTGLLLEAARMNWEFEVAATQGLETERKKLIQELEERKKLPHVSELEALHRLLYPASHPYHRPAVGIPDEIRNIQAEDVVNYVRKYFIPGRAVLVVVGDISVKKLLAEAERRFATLSESPSESEAVTTLEPLQHDQRNVLPARVRTVRTYIGYRTAGYGQQQWYSAALFSRNLGIGRANPLQKQLVQQWGIAQEVRVHLESMMDASTVAFCATGRLGVAERDLESALGEAIANMPEESVTAGLDRAKKMALIEYHASTQKLSHRADRIACLRTFDKQRKDFDESASLSQVRTEDVIAHHYRCCLTSKKAFLSIVPEMARA